MPGIHHVTAIAGDPVKNIDFYTRDLGLRLVKKTVNFDDPSTYHLYYGDETGRPGTILTFFPWTTAPAGRRGVGEAHQTAFRVPLSSIGYWTERFVRSEFRTRRWSSASASQSCLPQLGRDGARARRCPRRRDRARLERRGDPLRTCDPRPPGRDVGARQRGEDRGDPDRCVRLPRDRP